MFFRPLHIISLFVIGIFGFIGWRGYSYFFDKGYPIIQINGIEADGFYAGDIQCLVSGSDNYKVNDISVWLDNHPLIKSYKINARNFEHSFSIPTKTLPNGKHLLKVEASNSTYEQHKTMIEIPFSVDNIPLQGAFVKTESENKVFQGRTLHVQFQVNKEVKEATIQTLSKTFECFKESKNSLIYEVFVPISCEETPNEYLYSINVVDRVGNSLTLENKFQVVMFPFKKQLLKVDSEKVKTEKEVGLPAQQLELALEELAKKSPHQKLWQGVFYPPIDIKSVSTDYGTVRTTQEKGRYMHKAVDVLDTPKSVVWATQDGIVVIKERYAHSGNTVVIDHGYGLFSLFFHLDKFADIAVNDRIKRGNPIGTLGMTGYASGYHLHWEMRIDNMPVDPLQWIKPSFLGA